MINETSKLKKVDNLRDRNVGQNVKIVKDDVLKYIGRKIVEISLLP